MMAIQSLSFPLPNVNCCRIFLAMYTGTQTERFGCPYMWLYLCIVHPQQVPSLQRFWFTGINCSYRIVCCGINIVKAIKWRMTFFADNFWHRCLQSTMKQPMVLFVDYETWLLITLISEACFFVCPFFVFLNKILFMLWLNMSNCHF